MKQRMRARNLTQRQLEQDLYAGVRPHLGNVLRRRQARLTREEQAFLSSITTSGQFTLEAVTRMYASVKRMRTAADVIEAMTDADLDRVLEEGKASGLYETFEAIADARAGKTTRTRLKRL
jgi:hypothetical protein